MFFVIFVVKLFFSLKIMAFKAREASFRKICVKKKKKLLRFLLKNT